MTPSRRSLLSRLLRTSAFLGAALTVGLASAQSAKPIRLLVGFPPGGGSDAIARTLSEKLKDELGVPVVVENRPGAGHRAACGYKDRCASRRLFFRDVSRTSDRPFDFR